MPIQRPQDRELFLPTSIRILCRAESGPVVEHSPSTCAAWGGPSPTKSCRKQSPGDRSSHLLTQPCREELAAAGRLQEEAAGGGAGKTGDEALGALEMLKGKVSRKF